MVRNFEKYLNTGNEFINKVADRLGAPEDKEHAFRVTQAVLHTLRDRITTVESMNLISQLPLLIKGIYVDGWNIAKENVYQTKDEFIDAVLFKAGRTSGRDFGPDPAPEIKAVFAVIKEYVSNGEIEDIKKQVPKAIAEFLFENN